MQHLRAARHHLLVTESLLLLHTELTDTSVLATTGTFLACGPLAAA